MTLKKSQFSVLEKVDFRLRTAFVLVRLFLFSALVNGSHLAGTEMTYSPLGNGIYRITYFIYTDAASNAPGQLSPLEVHSASCGRYFTSVLSLQNNTGELINGTCQNTLSGASQAFKKWTYSGDIQLPASCPDWKLSASECCRSNAITSIQQPDRTALYTEVMINTDYGDHASPSFTASPVFNLVAGQQHHFSLGLDAAGLDSVQLHSVAPLLSSVSSVSYMPGYSERNPVRSILPLTLDSKNGAFDLYPVQQETGIIAFRADGYKNGQLVSSVYREHLIRSVMTGTHAPVLSGYNGSATYDTAICAGRPFLFDLMTSDVDAGSTIRLEIMDSLPGAILSTSAGRTPGITLNWTPPSALTGTTWYNFRVRVSDNDCPFNNEQVFTYNIKVSNWLISVLTTPVSCLGIDNGSATVVVSGNDVPLKYSWTNNVSQTSFAGGLTFGNQHVIVSEESGCSIQKTFYIAGQEGISPVSTVAINTTCQGGNDGVAGVILPVADSNYSIRWSTGEATSFISGLTTGSRIVTVTDRNSGCSVVRNIVIGYNHATPHVDLGSSITACTGRTITLDASTSNASTTWQDGSAGPTFSVTQSGTYSATITDSFGCSATSNVNVLFQMCSGMNEPEETGRLSLMPNPASEFLTITNPGQLLSFETWSIHDCSGRLVLSGAHELNGSAYRIDVSAFDNGLYILTANGSEGTSVLRFIKS